ncbi:RNA polymerase sigma-54 factor [Rhodovulum iodosum]|uniref:RNA polymerase sigma-54 factor n=1 Tax=Rhodovulum iodosum TaxID=68291 RepID=A0ABV3XX19_9RHOB|nr:RNA polymerase factor sigma-54 [Rhodovulum robiginosum]RSK37738.1 RNA polymerase sigma-54 factor [Rhodovulum robiginosum]
MEMIVAQRQTQGLAMTAKMQAALRILQMTNLDLSAHLAEQALENPCLEVTMPDAAPPLPTGVAGGARAQDWDEIAALESGKPSLYAHVADQIALAFPDDGPRRVAMVFVEALEPTGWLGTPVEAVAASARVAVPVAEAVLTRLHQLEPAGLFARSLAECLKLQAEDKGLLTWELSVILDNLALIAEGRIDDLAEMCDGTPADVRAALAAIRGLDPKPGLAFAAAEAPILPPDLRVVRRADGWTVEVNRGSLPSLRIREGALTWADAEALAYMRRARSSARWLKRAIERRQATLLATAAVLVRHQAAFLDGGPRHLRPLTAEAVAEELELHPSTISRAVADRLIETPRGTLPLRVFFSRAVAPGNAEGPSQDAAMALVGDIVAGEDRSKPLSDAAIVKKATAAGVPLARRTVAKYRDLLGIPSSYDRRQAAALTA